MKAIYSFLLVLALFLYFSSFSNTTDEKAGGDGKKTENVFGMP